MSRMFLTCLLAGMVLPALAAEPAGVVKTVKGQVAIERPGEAVAAIPGARVRAGDRIVTGRDGQVGITLQDNTLLSAGPDSTLVLDDFVFDTTTHAGAIDAQVKRGTVAVVSGKIAKQSPETVRFRTPNAILGVRGTSFVIDAGSGETDAGAGNPNAGTSARSPGPGESASGTGGARSGGGTP